MILFTQSTAVLHKYLNDALKILCLLQFFPEVAQNSLRIPSVFHVQRNPWVFQVFPVCGHPGLACMSVLWYIKGFGDWECSCTDNDTLLCWAIKAICWNVLNSMDDIHSFDHLAEYNVSTVQPGCCISCYEELGTVCVDTWQRSNPDISHSCKQNMYVKPLSGVG